MDIVIHMYIQMGRQHLRITRPLLRYLHHQEAVVAIVLAIVIGRLGTVLKERFAPNKA
jgi:hypothetical protein